MQYLCIMTSFVEVWFDSILRLNEIECDASKQNVKLKVLKAFLSLSSKYRDLAYNKCDMPVILCATSQCVLTSPRDLLTQSEFIE